jgi:hypothetical protein
MTEIRHEPKNPVRGLDKRTRQELFDPRLVYASTDMRAWIDCEERAEILGLPLNLCDGLCYCPHAASATKIQRRLNELERA